MKKLSLNEMEKIGGGCPGIQDLNELVSLYLYMRQSGNPNWVKQAEVIKQMWVNGDLVFAPAC
jgi:hypothetical protein